MSFRITVNHAHVFPPEMNPNGTLERLQRVMDDCNIAEAVCFAPFPHQCDKSGLDNNGWLANSIRGNKRYFAFGTIDPRRNDIHDQVKRCKELGFLGLKVHPNAQDLPIVGPKSFEVYAAAQDLGMFITFHSGVHQSRMKDFRLLLFDEVAWEFPNLKFSMEHIGGYHFFNEALAVLFNHSPTPWNPKKSNVFAGWASIFTTNTNRFWHIRRERLLEAIAQVGVQQMIFGLDFPYNLERETQTGLETVYGLGLTRDDQALILGGNLRRELGIS